MANVALIKISAARSDLFLNSISMPFGASIQIPSNKRVSIKPVWKTGKFLFSRGVYPNCYLSKITIGDMRLLVVGTPEAVSKAFKTAAKATTNSPIIVPFPETEMSQFSPPAKKSRFLDYCFGGAPFALWCLENPSERFAEFPDTACEVYGPKTIAHIKAQLGSWMPLADRLRNAHREMTARLCPVDAREKIPKIQTASGKTGAPLFAHF